MPCLELHLLGGFAAHAGRGVALDIPAKKSRALLAYLGVSLGQPSARDKLASLIWGDISRDEQARRSLRQALTTLRRSLPEGALLASRDAVRLCDTSVAVDVERFERLAAQPDRQALEAAMELYRGELLEGFSPRADGFDEWLGRERQRLRELALSALQRLAELQERAAEFEPALASAMRLVAMDPLRELGHRLLMRLYAESGRTSEALRQFRALEELLKSELGAEPDPETVALVARIQARRERAPASPEPRGAAAAAPSGAELRQVCALCAVATDAGAAGLGSSIARRLERFGATIVREGGDLGLGVFGVERATGAEVQRAIRAGLALEQELAPAVRVGIATGPLWIDRSRPGALRGDVLRQAAELCERAGEGVVVSAAVARSLGPRLALAPAPAGRAAPRRVLSWLEACDAWQGTPIVGRGYELAQLEAALGHAANTGRGRAFIVRGEAGIGKTRLVAQLPARASSLGFEVHVRGLVDLGTAAEEPVASLLREWLGRTDADAMTALSRAVGAGLVPSDDMPPLLDALQRLPAAVRDAERASREEQLRRRRRAVTRLLELQCARTPRLIWIDDLHFADRATLLQVADWMAAASQRPLVIVATTRIDGQPDGAEFRAALRGSAVTTMDIGPLSPEESLALAQQLESRRGSRHVAQAIERADGHPLFLEQLLYTGELDTVPDTVQTLIQTRTDRLDAADRVRIAAAAVLGTRFSLEALQHLLGGEPPDIDPLVLEALVVPDDGGGRFVHALIRDAVYAGLTDERRAELHRLAASHYAGRDPTLRARHLDRAADPEAPRAHAEAAATERRRGNIELAEELCSRGLALASSKAERFTLALQWGEALSGLGRLEDALRAFQEARASAPERLSEARAWLGSAAALRVLDRQGEALAALDQAERRIDPTRDHALLSSVHYLRGSVVFPLGDAAACLRWHTLALEAAQAAQSELAEARALSGIADAHYISGRFATARHWFSHCERSARAAGALDLELSSQGMSAICDLVGPQLRLSRQACISVAERSRAAGALRTEAMMRTAVSWGSLFLGEWQLAHEHATRAVELAARIGARRFEALGLSYGVLARLELEPAPEVELMLGRALELAEASGIGFAGGAVYAARLAAERDPERLRALFEDAEPVLAASTMKLALAIFVQRGIMAALHIGEPGRARRYASYLEAACADETHVLGGLIVDFGRSLADHAEGRRDPALEATLRSLRARLLAAELGPSLAFLDHVCATQRQG